jgi:ABC-type nitrate/sulfonate/bicarbonate transport system substrate-binding protein
MTELVVGFIPLLDCASMAVARELGFAGREGLSLTLVRESSWANIRDRLIVGHFDAAHMLGPMAVASSLGIGHVRVPVVAPFALGLGGNAVTVSTAVRREMLAYETESPGPGSAAAARVAGAALKRVVDARARSNMGPLTFGMVYPFSCHNYELRYWLAASGIDPDRDVRLVVIPPPLLNDSMMAGYIDGFCVGEPWNSVAAEAGAGSVLMPTSAIWKRSPEKVLGCRADWAARHPEPLAALLRSLLRASAWCADPANRDDLATLLAEPRYVGESRELLRRALAGRPVLSKGATPAVVDEMFVPFAHAATFPWVSHAFWFYSQMVRWGQTAWSDADLELVRATWRPDLYRSALAGIDGNVPASDTREEEFFDARPYDPQRLREYCTLSVQGRA